MKTSKKHIATQRRLMDKKLKSWIPLRQETRPPSGWLKAIRGALGITARQLAQILGVDMAAIIRLEKREPEGKLTLELMERVAKAMNCKVLYAIVPKEEFDSLESIINMRARAAAAELLKKVEHSMRLEAQGSPESEEELERLTQNLKEKMDQKIWGVPKIPRKKEKANE